MLAIGQTFFGFFAATLGAVIALRSRLPLKPALVLWTALVVVLISTFGLRSPELAQAFGVRLPEFVQGFKLGGRA